MPAKAKDDVTEVREEEPLESRLKRVREEESAIREKAADGVMSAAQWVARAREALAKAMRLAHEAGVPVREIAGRAGVSESTARAVLAGKPVPSSSRGRSSRRGGGQV